MKQEQSMEETEGEPQVISVEPEEADDSDQHDGLAQISDTEGDHIPSSLAGPIPFQEHAGMEESDGFVFAIHRRTVSHGNSRINIALFDGVSVSVCVAVFRGALFHSPPED